MIELHTNYKPGPRTFVHILVTHYWWLVAGAFGFIYLVISMNFGALHDPTVAFLNSRADWYIDLGMLTQWFVMLAVSLLFIAYLGVSVLYRQYSFFLDDHAFHLKRGLFSKQEITIPYGQITNVHIDQPYHWRLFGLAQLDITISSSQSQFNNVRKKNDFLMPCIDKSLAKELSHFLIRQASGDDIQDNDDNDGDEEDGEDLEVIAKR
jgi:uncharacterized membrane protein YdbT with pleckstrin-like domain